MKDEKLVAYYCKKNVSQMLLFKDNSKFRLNAINYSNDPSEGKTLLDFLYGEDKYPKEEMSNTEYEAFAACFTFNYDNLNMFRLYGKEEGKEGTGHSIVFKDSFFSSGAKMATTPPQPTNNDNLPNNESDEKFTLFRCIYIDPETRTVISTGQKEECLLYKEYRENNKVNFENYNNELFKDYKDKIGCVIEQVRNEMNELRKFIEDNKLNYSIVGRLLINLRYLTKHVAFKEEQECRIVRIHNLHNKEIKNDSKQMYIEYLPKVSDNIAGICFGPNVKDIELFQSMLKNKNLNIHCEKSTSPLV